jgi:hypothetical protein
VLSPSLTGFSIKLLYKIFPPSEELRELTLYLMEEVKKNRSYEQTDKDVSFSDLPKIFWRIVFIRE